ncbi:MAG TPA: VTT domain-containing protein [Vicinamibacteria bacterium]|nr:VTT domain-containing protein [Vicinamibacteria bacterium]
MARIALWIQQVLVPALGPLGVFLVAFLDSSFLSIPEVNDIIVITAAARHPETAWLYVLMATLGSVLGCVVLWGLGRRGGEAFLVKRFGAERVERTRAAFHRWDILALALPAVSPPPMPFKIFVLSAGVFGYPLRRFAVTLFLARGLRYTAWAVGGAIYGDEALAALRRSDQWFSRNLPLVLAISVSAVLLGVGYWIVRRRRRSDLPGLG